MPVWEVVSPKDLNYYMLGLGKSSVNQSMEDEASHCSLSMLSRNLAYVFRKLAKFFPQHLCFGYPFFLSLSDVAVMLDLVNFRPSVPQTDSCYYCYYYFFFAGCAAEKGKEKRRKRKISEKLKTQRQEKNTPLHFQKSQKNLKTHNQLQNLLKIR